jgi:predicted phosphodiesterase
MAKVRIICISDTHGQHAGLRVPDGDILIHAGDFMTYGNAPREIIDFNTWLGRQPHTNKIVIAGNYDRLFESHPIPLVLSSQTPPTWRTRASKWKA